MEDFFGYGTADSFYDRRRHINVIFQLFIFYKLKISSDVLMSDLKYALQLPTLEAAEFVCNNILNRGEHDYLNLLRERYNISDPEFAKIMSGYGSSLLVNKTPAGYTKQQNQRLLVQMLTARCYMEPKDNEAIQYINGVIMGWAGGMDGIIMNESIFIKYDQLWRKALSLYPTNYQLKQIEDYVIANIGL